MIAGCGGDTSAADVTCRDWQEKTEAREVLRDDFAPKFRETFEKVFEGDVPPEAADLMTPEKLQEAVDSAVAKSCRGEAEDFRPYQTIVDRELKP